MTITYDISLSRGAGRGPSPTFQPSRDVDEGSADRASRTGSGVPGTYRILRERERARAPCAYTPRSHENRKARGDYSTDARIATQSWQTVARFDPNANRPKHRVRNRPTSAMTKQDCDRRRQNRSAGARPSIGGTKSVTRDTATKVRYRGQRFTHAARSCLDARSQPHNPEPHRDRDTEFA